MAASVNRSENRNDVLAQATNIGDPLTHTDVSYLNLREGVSSLSRTSAEPSSLYHQVFKYDSEAFEYSIPGLIKERNHSSLRPEKKTVEQNEPCTSHRKHEGDHQCGGNRADGAQASVSSRRQKAKKKGNDDVSLTQPDPSEVQDGIIRGYTERLVELCSRAETLNEDQDDADAQLLSSTDLKLLVNDTMTIRGKKILHLVPLDILVRLLSVLDLQIRAAEGVSLDENEDGDSDAMLLVICALESIHAALAVMTHSDMPKQLYKEEVIERVLDFSRHQIMESMCAYDPSYRALHKPNENGPYDGEEDDEDVEFGSPNKKRRGSRSVKARRPTGNKVAAAVNAVLQKLCTILGFLRNLLSIERLPDSCILQLIKTSFSTFLVDNCQLLQLKATGLICGVFSSYPQHRSYLIDETVQLLWKLPFSKRALRTYLLPDEEQRQIQMITVLLIQLVQSSANLPVILRQALTVDSISDASVDVCYPTKCSEASTEACCLFWTRVLQRLTTVKTQDACEVKVIIENIVMDLLSTLNLPEYPASAPILEVLCVLLLQNAGLKSKDVAARCLAIDLLGTIAARLKRDAVYCSRESFWILHKLAGEDNADQSYPRDVCSICLDGRSRKTVFLCQDCQRMFHTDCMGVTERDAPSRGWCCHFCLGKKQLTGLQSHLKSIHNDDVKRNLFNTEGAPEASELISQTEIVQQLLLNYMQGAGSTDDAHLYARWFYLCLWYKDDPKSQEKLAYYLARLQWTSTVVSSFLTRESAKKISLAFGQKNSFSRGFDKILCMLLASLRENSPVIRAKALRAVSLIVEADPEVLCEKRVQSAVEGRFCDSDISVREAALELVGRHIASHPDVGLKYFEKVAERVKDTGLSVRKRAIKIIRDMCTSNANFSEFTSACLQIISCVSDEESSIQGDSNCALKSIRAALAAMTHPDMPKQLCKEKVTERFLDFSRHQSMESMCACNPSDRASRRPNENCPCHGKGCGTSVMTMILKCNVALTFVDTRSFYTEQDGSICKFYKYEDRYGNETIDDKILKLGEKNVMAVSGLTEWGDKLHELMSVDVKSNSSSSEIADIAIDCMRLIDPSISNACRSTALITCFDNVKGTHVPMILACDSIDKTVEFHDDYAFGGSCNASSEDFLYDNYNDGNLTEQDAMAIGKDCLCLAFGTAKTDQIGRRMVDEPRVGGSGKCASVTWRKREFQDLGSIENKFLFNKRAHLLL